MTCSLILNRLSTVLFTGPTLLLHMNPSQIHCLVRLTEYIESRESNRKKYIYTLSTDGYTFLICIPEAEDLLLDGNI